MDRSSQQCSSPDCNFNDASINCKGSCRQRFHAVCVGLSAASVPAIASSSSFFWFCDNCRDNIRTGQTTVAVQSVESGASGGETSCGSPSCIFTDQLVTCDGPCSKDFHGMCVKLSKSDLAVIVSSRNIVWFCTECNLKVIPVLDASDDEPTKEPDHQDNLEHPPDSSPNLEGIGTGAGSARKDPMFVATKVNNKDGQNVCERSEPSTNSEESANDDDSQTKKLETDSVMENEKNSPNIGNVSSAESPISDHVKDPHTEEFTFRAKTQSAQSLGSTNLNPVSPVKPETDRNNNSPGPKKRPLDIDSIHAAIAPKTVKKNSSRFSLYLGFTVPHMSDYRAEKAVRKALGMSPWERVTTYNVVPLRMVCPKYSTFRVELDARWKSVALDDATWRHTANYKEHREWFGRRFRD